MWNAEALSCGLKAHLTPYPYPRYLENNNQPALILIPLKGLKAAL